MDKAGQDSCSVHSLTMEASSYAELDHSSGPTCGFVAFPEVGPGATIGTQQGYPLLLQQGRARVVIHNYALRGGAAGPQGSGSYLTGPTAPDPLPAPRSGTGPVTPRVPEEGKLRANSRGLGPPIGVRDLPASVRSSHARRTNTPPGRGPGAPRVP